jgi:hypothetical protein
LINFNPTWKHPIESIIIPPIAMDMVSIGPKPYNKAPMKIRIPALFGNSLERMSITQKRTIPSKIESEATDLKAMNAKLCLRMDSLNRRAED